MRKRKTKPAKKAPAKKKLSKSTALARRQDVAIRVDDPHGMLSQSSPEGFELGELAHTGGVGTRALGLTSAERKILTRPVIQADVRVLPDSGLAYLPHMNYTRWLNEAFGPGEWGIAPAGKAMKVDQGSKKGVLLIVPHILYIHGIPAAWASGAAEYYEDNKRQTYDDVLESTVAYSLRRCCKRLGMTLEL